MANVKITDLTSLSGAMAGDDLFEMVDDALGTPASRKVTATVLRDFTNMAFAALTDANFTMAVNTIYVGSMAAWATTDRTGTLPAVADVGDRCGVILTGGNATYELILTAGSGDTLNGIAGGTEWSRVFITNEVVIMRCIVANTTWVVEYDGRIPQSANLGLTTDADGEGTATWVLPTSFGGAWTQGAAIGATTNTANGDIVLRRAGTYNTTVMSRAKDAVADGQYYGVRIGKNNAEYRSRQSFASGSQTTSGILNDPGVVCAAGDTLQLYYVSQAGGIGARGAAGAVTFISVTEVL